MKLNFKSFVSRPLYAFLLLLVFGGAVALANFPVAITFINAKPVVLVDEDGAVFSGANPLPVTGGGGGGGDVNVIQLGGNAIDLGTGNVGAGTQRVVLADDQPDLTIDVTPTTAVVNGRVSVPTPGTPVQITGGSTPFKKCTFQGDEANVDTVAIGGVGVIAALGTRTGVALLPFQSEEIENSDLSLYYVDAVNAGDSITYSCGT
jgi:hypothetical protein